MLAGKMSRLKYFPNCFWDSVRTLDLLLFARKKGRKEQKVIEVPFFYILLLLYKN
jgi:hypothetical protein